MEKLGNLNIFGNLTASKAQELLKKHDVNKNGELDTEEYNKLLETIDSDKVDLSKVDTDNNKTISKEEFALWDQKLQIQDITNNYLKTVSVDFSGNNVKYIKDINDKLKQNIENFIKEYTGDVKDMASTYKETLPETYRNLRDEILKDSDDSIKSRTIDNILGELLTPKNSDTRNNTNKSTPALTVNQRKRIAKELEKEADNFIKNYKGENLEADLQAHLNNFLNSSDQERLQNAVANFQARTSNYGAYIDSGNDLRDLKSATKEFLLSALEQNVVIKLGNTTVRTEAAINSVLNSYSDGETLLNDMNEVISNLSTGNKLEALKAEEVQKETEEAEKNFTNIKGESYKINASIIDYSGLIGYHNNGEIYERGKGWGGSRDKAFKKGQEYLQNEIIKNQLKSQITNMLKAKGIPFERIANVFENVYTQAIDKTLNTDGIITGRGARGLSKKGKAHINIKNLVDNFIQTFNKDIAKAIDDINKSSKDMDIIDIDFTQAGKSEDGKPVKEEETGADLSQLYASGKTITVRKKGADYFVPIAESMVDRLKPQMRAKAIRMCEANGVKFDETKFNAMFNNSKSIAVEAAVTGSGRVNHKGATIGLSGTTGVGAAAATSVAISGELFGISLVESSIPVVGWAAAGVTALAAGLAAIFGGGHHSESSLNTRVLLDTFAQDFQKSYTTWVNQESGTTTEEPEDNKKSKEPEQ